MQDQGSLDLVCAMAQTDLGHNFDVCAMAQTENTMAQTQFLRSKISVCAIDFLFVPRIRKVQKRRIKMISILG